MQLPQQFARRHTLIISGQQVRQLLGMDACIQAVEGAFRLHGEGRAETPAVASVRTVGGGFHVKAGVLGTAAGEYFAAKTNANFPANPAERGLPTIQGTIVLHDAVNGFPLAVLDSMEITAMRTAAATAVAARHLARRDAKTLAIIGCGLQGAQHLAALRLVRPLERVVLYDSDEAAARRLAGLAGEAGIPAALAPSAGEAANGVDLCVTCTSSTDFLLHAADVAAGTFVAGVGVDAEHKRELAPELLAGSKVVVDVLAQCAGFGDLHHAIDAGVMSSADVHAELGGVVAGIQPGRVSEDEIIVFDSTGMALQDVAAAALVYERARAAGLGVAVDFAA
jgi:ornithine cyclodeaminase/alanine dehydrogenase-like protein (mu-crystallin family)